MQPGVRYLMVLIVLGFLTLPTYADARSQKDKPRSAKGKPQLLGFSISRTKAFAYGSPANVQFRIRARSALQVNLDVRSSSSNRLIRTLSLGELKNGAEHRVVLRNPVFDTLPQGSYLLRIRARDARGRSLATSPLNRVAFQWITHHFPLRGNFIYGGPGGRFGDSRDDHLHQGQDIPAPLGTPVLAPRGGTVERIAYQAEGAGNYIVLQATGEARAYVFMHLRSGSIQVREGQRVRTGSLLAQVGNTGVSTGPHLHFEIWRGAWQRGKAIDPLRSLRFWDRYS